VNNWLASKKYEKVAILVQFIGPMVLFGKMLIKGEVIFWGTTYLQFTPWRWLAWNQMLSGELPLWNPNNGFGAPLFANYQSAMLYPPNILLWFGAWIGGISGLAAMQTVLVMLHLIGSGIGFVYLTRNLHFKPLSQAISGISYALCMYQVSRASFLSINAVLVWIPWILFAIYRWIEAISNKNYSQARRYIVFHLLLLICQLLGGHAQITWYTQILAFVWMLFWSIQLVGWKRLFLLVGSYIAVSGLAVLITAIQLLPTLELLSVSQRASEVGLEYATNYSFWPWRFLNLLSPNLFGNPGTGNYWVAADNYWENAIYIGLLPIISAIVSLACFFQFRKIRNEKKVTLLFGWFFIILSVPLMLGKYTPVFPWLYNNIPTFDLFQAPTRFSIWFVVGAILLSGCVLDNWRPPTNRRLYWSRLGFAGSFGAILFSFAANIVLVNKVNSTYLIGIFECSILFFILMSLNLFQSTESGKRKYWKIGVVIFILADLLYAGWMLNPGISPASIAQNRYPNTGFGGRLYVSLADEQTIKFNNYFHFDSFYPTTGWEGLPESFIPNNNLLSMQSSLNNFDPLLSARYADFMNMMDVLDSRVRDRLLSWLNVTLVEEVDPSSGNTHFRKLKPEGRYGWTGCVQVAPDQNLAMEQTNQWMTVEDLSSYTVVEAKYNPIAECSQGKGQITIIKEKTLRQIIQVDNPQPGWIIQKDSWYPGWIAEVDGHEAKILPVNLFLRAIHLEPGKHSVIIKYQPKAFIVGQIISLFSILIVIILNYLAKRRFSDV
jgi:uncharacterized membrane protein YfhO